MTHLSLPESLLYRTRKLPHFIVLQILKTTILLGILFVIVAVSIGFLFSLRMTNAMKSIMDAMAKVKTTYSTQKEDILAAINKASSEGGSNTGSSSSNMIN